MAEPTIMEVPATNYRSLFIFFGYLALAVFFTLTCCHTIYTRYQERQKRNDWATPQKQKPFFLFSFLSALSLGMTWYHMIRLFIWSYHNWEASPSGAFWSATEMSLVVRIGLWLKDTYVFQEAWETVSVSPTRVWWSGQIFGWTIGWSLVLGITGRRYGIPRVWVYMLLAQAVSVSFAANLYFAAVAVSRKANPKDGIFAWSPPLLAELIPVAFSLLDTVAVPIYAYKKEFMWVLMAPHIVIFIPCVLRPIGALPPASKAQGDQTTRRYAVSIKWVAAASILLLAHFTVMMLREVGTDVPYGEVAQILFDTIYVHPACSSVSWDVIMCTVSGIAWVYVHDFNTSHMVGGR
ncbi:hypothetical protein N7468_003504 [Penicillium chermesinum]|uniref:Uncharacterized protein n=1 Tax=Penicillium chermesinum TaxID=63820 RepID=A0A9W9TRP1_9EURO|nr:uncharacterized protein N7468_003504 [Penicillium chermesinum]KAJ5238885.1 hypothetical protein N7468_003504 [Penicillium chermesinum]KAJ6164523.1 hypothetical protein N7470_003195 [Penicillium chermesinum]